MQEVKDLIPQLQRLQVLYQSEDFKPLDKFLRSSYQQKEAELLSITWNSKTSRIDAAILAVQVNLLGVLLNLPYMVKKIKDDLEEQEAKQKQQAEADFDPLNVEGV